VADLYDRELAQIIRRLDMMVARGASSGITDGAAMQTMQADFLEGEAIDDLERFQSFGVTSVPPAGSDVLAVFIGGNRDQGVVLAINDRGSRPTGLKAGETMIYNAAEVRILLNADGELVIKPKTKVIIEAPEGVEIEARDGVTIKTDTRLRVEGDIEATGSITERVPS
jgi:phage baseplate assembly protein V